MIAILAAGLAPLWLPFVQAEPVKEADLARLLGKPDEITLMSDGTKQILFRHVPRYPGGVDLYTDASGRINAARFYLAPIGPIYVRSQIDRAEKLKSASTMAEVLREFGEPAQKRESRAHGAVLEYAWEGNASRSLSFTSLPHSNFLHRVAVDRDDF